MRIDITTTELDIILAALLHYSEEGGGMGELEIQAVDDLRERLNFDPANAIKLVADRVEEIQRHNVYRLLSNYSYVPGQLETLAHYLRTERADLREEIDSCLKDIAEENA